jgi:hypothetical protein
MWKNGRKQEDYVVGEVQSQGKNIGGYIQYICGLTYFAVL